jgi:hypothetical protein
MRPDSTPTATPLGSGGSGRTGRAGCGPAISRLGDEEDNDMFNYERIVTEARSTWTPDRPAR